MMSAPKRTGKRKTREQLFRLREPELGYYLIVTDTEATEENYLLGLRNTIPKALQGKLVLKVSSTKTKKLVDEAITLAAAQVQYCQPWIVFDRDKVMDFDDIIRSAEAQNIKVGWSNPCIEIWFSCYFGAMPQCLDSIASCKEFRHRYKSKTKQEYSKADPKLYQKLNQYGNEKKAISIAESKLHNHHENGNDTPSEMCPCTTLHELVKEITDKIDA